MTEPLPPKKDVVRSLLLRGSAFLHLDPRVEGVLVPAHLSSQPQVVLQIGLDLPIPIPDLHVGDDGVTATLSFQRAPFQCKVPWDAVFAAVGEDGKGMVWPEDLPTEIAVEVEREARRRKRGDKADEARRGPAPVPALATAADDDTAEDLPSRIEDVRRPPSEPSRPPRGPRKLPPYLRVIK